MHLNAGAVPWYCGLTRPVAVPVQAGLVSDEIRRLKALHKKACLRRLREMCASAAYYIAVAADQIYVDKASLVGSIGVLDGWFWFRGHHGQTGH